MTRGSSPALSLRPSLRVQPDGHADATQQGLAGSKEKREEAWRKKHLDEVTRLRQLAEMQEKLLGDLPRKLNLGFV